jgi:hypothetical protein
MQCDLNLTLRAEVDEQLAAIAAAGKFAPATATASGEEN